MPRAACRRTELTTPLAATLLAAVLALAACRSAPAAAPAAGATGLAEIEALIGAASCRRDEDCRAIGIGARACGGPEAYRAWSVIDSDERRLTERVQQDAAARRAELERLGMHSTCQVLPRPRVSCRIAAGAASGRCVLQSGRQAD
ncbi:MAG: hypothetical protein QM750_05540 [Rubrivivax sp.]